MTLKKGTLIFQGKSKTSYRATKVVSNFLKAGNLGEDKVLLMQAGGKFYTQAAVDRIVREAQAEAWDEGLAQGVYLGTKPNPYRESEE